MLGQEVLQLLDLNLTFDDHALVLCSQSFDQNRK
jgi:hypothetical protein